MKLGNGDDSTPEINITPLIDVVFLLLIFFMVSTTFSRQAELEIELPEASAEAKEPTKDVLEVAIDAKGRYYVNGKPLLNTQAETLKRAMREQAGEEKSAPVVISADAKTPHQAVITAMDAAQQLGLTHLTFATARAADEAGQ